MLIKPPSKILSSEITPESVYQNRRYFIQNMIALTAAVVNFPVQAKGIFPTSVTEEKFSPLSNFKKSPLSSQEELTPLAKIRGYANFYEFGTSKTDPHRYASQLKTRPWSVTIVGEVEKPGTIDIEEIFRRFPLEERIYRLRCVEGWSMVIPWIGLPLADFLKRFQPTSKAKYVQFFTLYDPQQMPKQQHKDFNWPYTEGLRIDEAMHPLTILSVGLYGTTLPPENGAPLRLVVPWKYGFKSIKSIVKIRLLEELPLTTWQTYDPEEYGFYANVNPEVPHPRWSQAKERRIGEFIKHPTLMFNGYADQVASLYTGMDLRTDF